jgi:hypothetical protein
MCRPGKDLHQAWRRADPVGRAADRAPRAYSFAARIRLHAEPRCTQPAALIASRSQNRAPNLDICARAWCHSDAHHDPAASSAPRARASGMAQRRLDTIRSTPHEHPRRSEFHHGNPRADQRGSDQRPLTSRMHIGSGRKPFPRTGRNLLRREKWEPTSNNARRRRRSNLVNRDMRFTG